mgnify:FL=1
MKKNIKNIPSYIQKILDSVPACIYWKDLNGIYLGYNAFTFEKMHTLGLSNLMVGKTDYDLFSKEVADNYREIDCEVIERKAVLTCEEAVTLPNKQQLIQLSTKKPLFGEDNEITGIICITVDITAQKKLEENLKISQRSS